MRINSTGTDTDELEFVYNVVDSTTLLPPLSPFITSREMFRHPALQTSRKCMVFRNISQSWFTGLHDTSYTGFFNEVWFRFGISIQNLS